MACVVRQCCCGCTLKTGSLVIGIVQIVISAIICVILAWSAYSFSVAIASTAQFDRRYINEGDIKAIQGLLKGFLAITCVTGILYVLQIIFGSLLAYGANKEKPKFIKPWIIYTVVRLIIAAILYTVAAILYFVHNNPMAGVQVLATLIITGGLEVYFIIVVNSFHIELTQGRASTRPKNFVA